MLLFFGLLSCVDTYAERAGLSLVITRTSRGEALIQAASALEAIHAETLPVSDIALMQPYQALRKKQVLGRILATWLRRGQVPRYRHLGLPRASLMTNPITWIRNALGTFRRANGEIQ